MFDKYLEGCPCLSTLIAGFVIFAVIVYHLFSTTAVAKRQKRQKVVARKAIKYVHENAEAGNPDHVLATIDQFCDDDTNFMMNVGPEKGRIVDKAFAEAKPKIALELGAYCGYSAVRLGRLLKPGQGRFISLEIDPEYAEFARGIVKLAGVDDRVEVVLGSSHEIIPQLKDRFGIDHLDFVFIDHWKDLYIRDLKLIESNNLLRPGSVVVADNILHPGAPEFKARMLESLYYKSVIHPTHLEYSKKKDEVLVAEFLGY